MPQRCEPKARAHFIGLAPLCHRFREMRLQLLVDFAANTLRLVPDLRYATTKTYHTVLKTRLTAEVTVCQRDSSSASCFLPAGGQFVDARPAAGILRDPLGANPAGFLHAVQRRIERAFFGAQHFAGSILDRRHDGVAVQMRAAGEDFQNQQIERALERVGSWAYLDILV